MTFAAWSAQVVRTFRKSNNVCAWPSGFNWNRIKANLNLLADLSVIKHHSSVRPIVTEVVRNWVLPSSSYVHRARDVAPVQSQYNCIRPLHSLRLPSTAGRSSSLSTSSKEAEGNTGKAGEENSSKLLWPVKIFLVYGFFLLTYKLFPLMSESIVISGLRMCQIESDTSYLLVGLQRVRFYLQGQELCKKLFLSNNNEGFDLAGVLSRSLTAKDRDVQAEALALLEKVIDIWPESVDHLNKAGIAVILNTKSALKHDREGGDEAQLKIVRILAALEKQTSD
jgi:hypothetical protein